MQTWILPHSFEFEGKTVKYGTMGEGLPVIVVHGTPWSSFNMRHIIKGLSATYKVYYFDLLGYGSSQKSEDDVSLGIQNRLLDALIEFWEVENPYVIGHDFGGATVLRNHILNQREYKKMVLIDPVAISPWGSPFFKHVREHEEAFAGVPDYIHASIVETYIKTAAFQELDKESISHILAPWIGVEGKPAFYRQIAQSDSKFTDEIQERFDEVLTPTLILWGKEDTWIPLSQGQALQNKIKHSRLVEVPDSGHLVIEEKPETLLKEIVKFFEK